MSLHQAWLMWLQSSPLNKSLKVQSAAKAAARPLCHPTQEPAWFPWLPALFCSFWWPNLLTWALPRSPHMPFWVATGLAALFSKGKGFGQTEVLSLHFLSENLSPMVLLGSVNGPANLDVPWDRALWGAWGSPSQHGWTHQGWERDKHWWVCWV